MDKFTLYNDDCLNALKTMEDNSIDSCVTDPPYGLSFMGKAWDYDVPKAEIWKEVFRVLKPGGHVLAFFGSRTYHRGVVQIEDAGFEIRDQIMWLYGSGFPKSHNIGKGIDASAGAKRTVKKGVKPGHEDFADRETKGHLEGKVGNKGWKRPWMESESANDYHYEFEPATDDAKKWEGWGTALKPAHEPIVVARKPITQTVAKNVLEHGTGALNIDGCRVETKGMKWEKPRGDIWKTDKEAEAKLVENGLGRWPANIIHDGSDEVVKGFPDTKSGNAVIGSGIKGNRKNRAYGAMNTQITSCYADEGSAARFFYSAKASKTDKDEGLENFLAKKVVTYQTANGASGKPSSMSAGRNTEYKNIHPTVKPTDLMKYLCRLVTPKGGIVLDPFMGSGSTGKAAAQEGFKFIGIEMSEEYFEIAEARIKNAYDGITVSLENFFS